MHPRILESALNARGTARGFSSKNRSPAIVVRDRPIARPSRLLRPITESFPSISSHVRPRTRIRGRSSSRHNVNPVREQERSFRRPPRSHQRDKPSSARKRTKGPIDRRPPRRERNAAKNWTPARSCVVLVGAVSVFHRALEPRTSSRGSKHVVRCRTKVSASRCRLQPDDPHRP